MSTPITPLSDRKLVSTSIKFSSTEAPKAGGSFQNLILQGDSSSTPSTEQPDSPSSATPPIATAPDANGGGGEPSIAPVDDPKNDDATRIDFSTSRGKGKGRGRGKEESEDSGNPRSSRSDNEDRRAKALEESRRQSNEVRNALFNRSEQSSPRQVRTNNSLVINRKA